MDIRESAIEAKNQAREWATERANLWADVAGWSKNGSEIEAEAKLWAGAWSIAATAATVYIEMLCLTGISGFLAAELDGLDQDEINEWAWGSAWRIAHRIPKITA